MDVNEKISAVMRYIVSDSEKERRELKKEIRIALKEEMAYKDATGTSDFISSILSDVGVPEILNGYEYLALAIERAVECPDIVKAMTKELYPYVAARFDVTPGQVERSISYAITAGMNRNGREAIEKYFGNTINPNRGKPTVGEFIARMANVVRRRTENG